MDSLSEEAGDLLSVAFGDKVHSSFLSIICKSSCDSFPLSRLWKSVFFYHTTWGVPRQTMWVSGWAAKNSYQALKHQTQISCLFWFHLGFPTHPTPIFGPIQLGWILIKTVSKKVAPTFHQGKENGNPFQNLTKKHEGLVFSKGSYPQ